MSISNTVISIATIIRFIFPWLNCLCPERVRRSRRRHSAPPSSFFIPPPICSPTQREFLLTLSPGSQTDLLCYDQVQSPLFAKLPPELRRLIYQKAVGEQLIQLKVTEGIRPHFTHEVWPATVVGQQWRHPLFQNFSDDIMLPPRRRLLSLLITCRRVYVLLVLHFKATG